MSLRSDIRTMAVMPTRMAPVAHGKPRSGPGPALTGAPASPHPVDSGNGYVSIEEFLNAMSRAGVPVGHGLDRRSDKTISEEEAARIVGFFDKEGDGYLRYHEFMTMLQVHAPAPQIPTRHRPNPPIPNHEAALQLAAPPADGDALDSYLSPGHQKFGADKEGPHQSLEPATRTVWVESVRICQEASLGESREGPAHRQRTMASS